VDTVTLPAGFLLARDGRFSIKARDQGAGTERALEKVALAHPLFQIIAQHGLGEEVASGIEPSAILADQSRQAPDAKRIVGATKSSGLARARSIRRVSSMPSVWCASRPSNG
jgi:hypothetical protein